MSIHPQPYHVKPYLFPTKKTTLLAIKVLTVLFGGLNLVQKMVAPPTERIQNF